MEATAAVATHRTSALQTVWSSPLYRGATAAMFLSGLGTSAAAPQIVLFLVKDLGQHCPWPASTI
jgi:SET family sugar efflux transporter-like MFS transporter